MGAAQIIAGSLLGKRRQIVCGGSARGWRSFESRVRSRLGYVRRKPTRGGPVAIVLALLTVVAGLVVGTVLFATGHILLGLVACLAGLPIGIGVWIAVNDRSL